MQQQPHQIYLTRFQQQSLYMAAKDERVIAAAYLRPELLNPQK